MNKRFTLFLLYVLSACVPSVLADPIIEDGVYSISCEQGDRDGFVGLGAYHDIDPFICYIKDNQELTEDAYWVVTNTRSGYTFRNEASGQYLIYTTGRVDAYYKGMTLADEAPEDKSHFWDIIDAGNGYVYVQSTISPSYYWNLRYSQGLLGTYAGSSRSNNERFYFTKKADPGPGPGPGPGPEEPEVANAFPKALHVYLKDGRVEAYPLKYITNYSQTNIRLIIETNIGKTFTYRQADIDSISENTPTNFPTFVSFKFNNKFNDQLFSDCPGEMVEDTVFLTVAAIGKRLTPSFKLPDTETLVYVDGELQNSKVSRRRFDKDTYYLLTRQGITMLLPDTTEQTRDGTTYSMQPYGRLVRIHVDWLTDRADVPRIYINTADGQPITSKDYYKDAEITIDGRDIFPSMETTAVQIKGRGNSSWGWPKKPYRLKFEEKVKPLGMTKGKSWVLLSNYQTGSLMSNAIGMKAANLMGASAANHIVPVDLYLNGEYRGSYNLTEKVGFSNNSVDLDDETAAAMLELDSYYDEPEGQKFKSMPYNLPINIKEPDFSDEENPTNLTLEMVESDFNSFLTTLYRGQDISKHVDIEQLVRFLMVNELICNFELYHPKSTFCYRESFESDTSKYVFGPVWDLDWAFGYEQNRNYFQGNTTSNYWLNMPNFEVKQFIQDLRWKYEPMSDLYQELWEKFMEEDLTELMEFCQDYYDFAHNSFDNNREVWGDRTNYADQAITASNWLETRANQIYSDILNGVKPEPVEPIEPIEFENDKLYTIECRRGALVLNEDHTGLDVGQIRTDAPEEDKQFAIINIEGTNYLYSPVTKMYLAYNNNGTWVPQLGSPIVFDPTHADSEYLYMISAITETGSTLYFNNSGTRLVINSWNTPDDGDRWKIEAVDDFDPTEAFDLAQGYLYAVTTNIMFNGELVASETKELPYGVKLPEPSSELNNAFVTLEPLGDHPLFVTEETIVTYEAIWNGPFAFTTSASDAQWYNMSIRSDYVVGKQDSEPYYPEIADDLMLSTPEYQWAFGGNPYHLKVYNRSTGLREVLTLVDNNAVMREGDYTWDLLSNKDGFVLRVPGTAYTCLNQIGGYRGALQGWNSSNSPYDNGSTFRVMPALPVDVEDIYALTDDRISGRQTSGMYDLSGRRVSGSFNEVSGNRQWIDRPKKGVYIVQGRKVVVK